MFHDAQQVHFAQDAFAVDNVVEQVVHAFYCHFLACRFTHCLHNAPVRSASDLLYYFVVVAYHPVRKIVLQLRQR